LIVNRNSLACADDQDDSEDDASEDANSDNDDAVCATNGVTYPSLCRLLQDTGNEAVAYAGECDRDECQGGSVSSYIICLKGWGV
jgi:reversion-inducing cysteine-rich kazal motif protein